jgi:hypothetical protein
VSRHDLLFDFAEQHREVWIGRHDRGVMRLLGPSAGRE